MTHSTNGSLFFSSPYNILMSSVMYVTKQTHGNIKSICYIDKNAEEINDRGLQLND